MASFQTAQKNRFFKLKLVLILFFAVLGAIFLRLYHLQVQEQSNLRKKGDKNCIKTEIVLPLRGNFFDCKKVLLAANRPVFDLYWQGTSRTWDEKIHAPILTKVLNLVGIEDFEALKGRMKFAQKYGLKKLIKEDLSFDELCKISEQCSQYEYLLIKNRFDRIYPYQTLASHLLGYLSRAEKIGCSGLEKVFEHELRGEEGSLETLINSVGKPLDEKTTKKSQPGADMDLTIDFELQTIAESLFEKGQSGSFLLMDAESGALRVFLSYPNYDPNMFLAPISEEEWNAAFAENTPLLNRAIKAQYPPSSIFKLVTLAAGVEEKIIDTNQSFFCPGYLEFCQRKYFCKRRTGHGYLDAVDALSTSCNVYCFEIARMLRNKIDTLSDYAFRFGLGSKTNFLLPENTGLIPTSAWKRQVKKEPWWAGETLSASIGQSYLLVTPLQITRMIGGVATGKLVKPRALEQEAIEQVPLKISLRTLNFLRESMKKGAKHGTSQRLALLRDFDLYAKTGTAQVCSLSVEKTNRKYFEHAWFAGFFNYRSGKPMVLVIMLEHVEDSKFAVIMAGKFLRAYRHLQETNEAISLNQNGDGEEK